jgi:hypothetical protein
VGVVAVLEHARASGSGARRRFQEKKMEERLGKTQLTGGPRLTEKERGEKEKAAWGAFRAGLVSDTGLSYFPGRPRLGCFSFFLF